MIKKSVSIDEFRSNLAEFVGKVMYGNDRVVIKKYNRDAVVLLSVEDYEKLLDPTKRLSKSRWNEAVKQLETVRDTIPEIDPTVIEKEVDQTVQSVRSKKNQA